MDPPRSSPGEDTRRERRRVEPAKRRPDRRPGNVSGPGRSVAVVVEQLWRAVGLFRFATLGYAAVLILRDHDVYAHPARAYVALAVMAAWSLVTAIAYA